MSLDGSTRRDLAGEPSTWPTCHTATSATSRSGCRSCLLAFSYNTSSHVILPGQIPLGIILVSVSPAPLKVTGGQLVCSQKIGARSEAVKKMLLKGVILYPSSTCWC